MGFSLHTGRAGLECVRLDWDALAQRNPAHVFQTTGFCCSWADTVGVATKARPLIVTHETDGAVTALFPACAVHYGPLRLITWLGGPHVLDYGDILYEPERCGLTAEEFVGGSLELLRDAAPGAVLYLPNVRDDATCREALASRLRPFKHSVAPYLALETTFDSYIDSLPRRRRQNLQRVVRKLHRAGDVTFEVIDADDPGFEPLLTDLLALQKLRFRGRLGNAPIFDPCYAAFRIEHASRDSRVSCAKLTLDGQLIAASLQCIYRDRMYFLITAFDERFAEFGPGKLLVRELLAYCCDHEVGIFDFCWGAEEYKYLWTDRQVGLDTFVSDGAVGRLLTAAAGIRRRLTGTEPRPQTAAACS